MKRILYSAMVIAIMTGCGRTQSTETDLVKPIAVAAIKVVPADGAYDLRYSGTIEALQTIPLTFQVTGTVDKIYVEVGDAVKKGQLLASVDNSDMLNVHNVSLAKYQQAKDAYTRLKAVHEQGSLTEIKWVEMESNMEQAKSSLDMAKNNLEKCSMRAPVSGIVGRRNIEVGQSAIGLSNAPIELVKIETVYVKISVPENEISKIAKGKKAIFTVSALDDKTFEGTVTNVSPVADAMSRTYSAKIMVNNSKQELMPGMVCDVLISMEKRSAIPVVPYSAVSKDSDGNTFVYLVNKDSSRVKKQVVTVGNYNGKSIEVLKGLAIGEVVVCQGSDKLSDNCLITL